MSNDFITLHDFFDAIKTQFGDNFDVNENTTLIDLETSCEDFTEFLESQYSLDSVVISTIYNSLREDMILYDIYNAYLNT